MFVVRHLMSLILHFCCLAKSNTPACQSTPTTVCCYFSNFPIRAEEPSSTKLNFKLFCCDVTRKKGSRIISNSFAETAEMGLSLMYQRFDRVASSICRGRVNEDEKLHQHYHRFAMRQGRTIASEERSLV